MKPKDKNKETRKGLSETQRWVMGVVLFAFAVFLLVAVVSYYFYWQVDQTAVRSGRGVVMNPTGPAGARLADYIVGQWFGVFGVVIPLLLVVLALRVIGLRPLSAGKLVLSGLALMILGSLTLGFAFGDKWGVFGTGTGGAHGIYLSQLVVSYLGSAGTGLLLLLGWVLLGVYITRRTIAMVNGVGKGIYKGMGKMGEVFTSADESEYRQEPQPEQMPVSKPRPEEEPELEEEVDDRVIEIVRPHEPEPVAELKPMPAPDNMIVEFGQEAGDYIVGKRKSPKAGESRVIEVVQPRGDGELMAGGVVEAAAHGAMKVVVPGRNDVQLDDAYMTLRKSSRNTRPRRSRYLKTTVSMCV